MLNLLWSKKKSILPIIKNLSLSIWVCCFNKITQINLSTIYSQFLYLGADSLSQLQLDALLPWIQSTLGTKVKNVKITGQLDSHPCVITVDDMTAARHFIKTQLKQMDEDMLFSILQPQFELNPK